MIRCILKNKEDYLLFVEAKCWSNNILKVFTFEVLHGGWKGTFDNGVVIINETNFIISKDSQVLFWDADFLYYGNEFQDFSTTALDEAKNRIKNKKLEYKRRDYVCFKEPCKYDLDGNRIDKQNSLY